MQAWLEVRVGGVSVSFGKQQGAPCNERALSSKLSLATDLLYDLGKSSSFSEFLLLLSFAQKDNEGVG